MKITKLCLLSALIPVNVLLADSRIEVPAILHDPFQRAELIKKSPVNRQATPQVQDVWEPRLKMTLRAGKNSMANINGRVIRLSEQIEGYRLIEVHERSVVLVKQGKKIQLTLDNEQ